MEPKKENINKITRKDFLRTCGSIMAGGSILGISGVLLKNKTTQQNKKAMLLNEETSNSPYKLISSFSVPEQVEAFELYEDKLIVAAANTIFIYDQSGTVINNFLTKKNIRDVAVENNHIYLLYPQQVEVYSLTGQLIQLWDSCSELSDYCSFAVTPESVFITDAAQKNISKYTTDGNFVKIIKSPNGFVIPSYSFGITHIDGTIYCSNSGRHQIESYTTEGDYITSFGKAGGASGLFCGCCNPVHLTYTSTGEILTSEKGNPRISCYSHDGQFRTILLDKNILGGGNTACEVKTWQDKLFVASKNMISVFQYDNVLAAQSSCSGCGVDCPLRKGITI